jgi:hypothetical protein
VPTFTSKVSGPIALQALAAFFPIQQLVSEQICNC